MNAEALSAIRAFELRLVSEAIRGHFGARRDILVLDVGAGTGEQAALLSELGYQVTALDIGSSAYKGRRVFPVQDYDGVRLPLDDESVDVVFSSNLLEHLLPLEPLLSEMARVLRRTGIAVHVVPSASWRVWTTLLHPAWVFKRAVQFLLGKRRPPPMLGTDSLSVRERPGGLRLLLPSRHGERGNFVTETWYFSTRWWARKFRALNWELERVSACGVFYSGTMLLGNALRLGARTALARVLGSSSTLFVLRYGPSRDVARGD
ncbi:class I SAM-dependent methyltransferase [Pseudomarimonas salicorniae]|uniref:Class I SAM-dependent methyltransferase n=1 Tax=Pseudomarimonas salicorniae TaxID=2933270 RepID=A0ABT0GFL7_9GAMM|nr:class I SAM-dependent methyltransferase [Lysobacter sp. CAU 1642]MCK7593334.1 class I SAM-dependent methyltransferase [Lysobacter sp. CAU 1642]